MNYQKKKTYLHHHYQIQHHGHKRKKIEKILKNTYVLRKNLDTINLEQNLYRDDDEEFEWKYNDSYDYLKNEEIKPYDKITLISNKVEYLNF